MKKLLFLAPIAVSLFAISCQDKDDSNSSKEVNVTFVVETPEMTTRAFGDGTSANDLYYGIYDADGNLVSEISKVDANSKETINLSTTINLRLVTGNIYSMIFWADNAEGVCSVDFVNKSMSFDPADANQEDYDAFWAYVEPFEVTSNMSKTVKLYRPFAQLNIGTDDILDATNAGMEVAETKVAVKIPTVLDLVSGTVSEEADVVYNFVAIPTEEKFPVEGYEYLSMNYLLVGPQKSTIDVEFGYSNGTTKYSSSYTFVPVQRNYRTNIFGSLLTSSVDINIVIEPAFIEPDYNVNLAL